MRAKDSDPFAVSNTYVTEESLIFAKLLRILQYDDALVGAFNAENYPNFNSSLEDFAAYIVPGCGFCRIDLMMVFPAANQSIFYDPDFSVVLVDDTPPTATQQDDQEGGGGGDGGARHHEGAIAGGVMGGMVVVCMCCAGVGVALVVALVVAFGAATGSLSAFLIRRRAGTAVVDMGR